MAEFDFTYLRIQLVHREIHNPAEPEYVGFNQLQQCAEFVADDPQQFAGTLAGFVGHERYRVTRNGTRDGQNGLGLSRPNEFRNRALELPIALDQDPGQSFRSSRLRVLFKAVEER